MPTVPRDLLPTPATAELIDESVVGISTIGLMPRHHRPDPTLHPRRWRLSWSRPSGAVADAIRRHHDEFPDEVFALKLPRTGEVVYVTYADAPRIKWLANTTAEGIGVEVEEALAHE